MPTCPTGVPMLVEPLRVHCARPALHHPPARWLNTVYLEHFRRYTQAWGGATGAVNRASISAARIERIE